MHRFVMQFLSTVFLMVFLVSSNVAVAQAFGIGARVSNTSLLINDLPPATGSMVLVSAFPNLDGQFFDMIGVMELPDGSGRIAVMIRDGRVFVFPKANAIPANVSLFLDLTDRVSSLGEFGLLGLAFDPNYGTNGDVYVYYTRLTNPESVVARYTNDVPADNSVDRATEDILLTLDQPFTNHNGGTIAFGPDTMLYLAFGDGGGDINRVDAQDTTNLLGSMLRIDVHTPPVNPGVQNYVIPPDNPFVGGSGPVPGSREEIWAYGFRNPFRWSFDALTGMLYLGDVGESLREEINIVTKGGNYGWPIMEGTTCFNTNAEGSPLPSCNQTGLTLPIDERINSSESISILGGYVYAASRVPELFGMYIYSDFLTANIWGLRYDGATVTEQTLLANIPGLFLFSLGRDASGEVYLLDNGDGRIKQLQPASPPPPNDFPTRLSDIPALLSAGIGLDQTGLGIIPYEPSAKLWSDGAVKERFMAIPGLGQIAYTAAGGWNFPDKTVLIKNFNLPQDFRDPINTAKRIETRLLIQNGGAWHGFSYEWNDAETDAVLLPGSKLRPFTLIDANGQSLSYEWLYPSRANCLQCHTSANNRVAGITTPQLNSNFTYPASGVTDNQLRTFAHINLFNAALPAPIAQLPSAPDATDTTATTVQRAEAYLFANCAMCHQPGGPTPVDIDFRWGVPLANRNIFNVLATGPTFGIPDPRRFNPGDPAQSVIQARIFTTSSANRMPPLGTSLQDTNAVALIAAWIELMTTTTGPDSIWVDFAHGGAEFGTLGSPFDTLGEGANNVATGGVVLLDPGNSPETVTVNKASTLQSTGGTVRVGAP